MTMLDLIIVGSGPAGTWAAYEGSRLGLKILMLDVGHKPPSERLLRDKFFSLRKHDRQQSAWLIGDSFQSLNNIHQPYLSPKLKAPRFSFVTEDSDKLAPIHGEEFSAVQSFAYGGLANAWGAGTYRYTDEDLASFSICEADLAPYYDRLVKNIGISGANDDLKDFFGNLSGTQPSHTLDRLGQKLFSGYSKRKSKFRKQGFTIGRPRIAVLSQNFEERLSCNYDNLSFWEPNLDYIYRPTITLDKLIAEKKIDYLGERLVDSFQDFDSYVSVSVKVLENETKESFKAARLILAAGSINSAKIVLKSFQDYTTEVPILDNQTALVPFVAPAHIGEPVDMTSHGLGQLIVVYKGSLTNNPIQGSFYSFTSMLGSEVICDFPLSMQAAKLACKMLLPAFSVMTFFYPDAPHPLNFLRLSTDGNLEIQYKNKVKTGDVERQFISLMRREGFFSHSSLIQVPSPGNGIHYAGTLPMDSRYNSCKYGTATSGRLRLSKHVYVADASVFPDLPAKNHTFTLMANAMRVASNVSVSLRKL